MTNELFFSETHETLPPSNMPVFQRSSFDLSMKTNFASQISMCDLSRNWDYEIDDELMADLVQGFH